MTLQPASRFLVTTDWLAQKLGAPDLVVVDGTYFLPNVKRDANAEYLAGHIPGAVRFDLDAVSDHSNPLPHMLPAADQFARDMGALGIADSDTIVVYDALGLFSSPRVWWTFRLFGAEKVFVLEGGLPKWKAEGRPLETGAGEARGKDVLGAPAARCRRLGCRRAGGAGATRPRRWSTSRPADRFRGEAPEPRPGVRSGHIPGSLSVPSSELVKDGKLLPADRAPARLCRRRRRSRQAGDHDLRLGRRGRDHVACARSARQGTEGALRRFLVGMGRPRSDLPAATGAK